MGQFSYSSRKSHLCSYHRSSHVLEVCPIPDSIEGIFWQVIQQNPIGYLYITELQNTVLFKIDEQNNKISASLDSVLQQFQRKGVDRIIIDIRSGAGGLAYIAEIIASRFINRTVKYAVFGENNSANSYSQQDQYISPMGYFFFQDKPLVIIVNLPVVLGKIPLLMLRQSGGPSQVIGTPTLRCTGSVLDRELPNDHKFFI